MIPDSSGQQVPRMSSDSKLTLTRVENATFVEFDPSLKAISEPELDGIRVALLEAGEVEPPLVALDLEHVEFFSSSFIELMFRLWNRLKARGGRFAMCNMQPYCKEVIEITNLHKLWPICDSREEALQVLSSDAGSTTTTGH